MTPLSSTAAWPALLSHASRLSGTHLRELFEGDPERFQRFSVRHDDLLFDFSKQRIDEAVLAQLLRLADETDLAGGIRALCDGDAVNFTEGRAALHVAMRADPATSGRSAAQALAADSLATMGTWVQRLRDGQCLGASGKPLRRLINLGIGGSDLGPRLAHEALRAQCDGPQVDFVANLDPADLDQSLLDADPETTGFIVSSKSFSTLETLSNARAARAWLSTRMGATALERHFFAVSNNIAAASAFGISAERCLFLPEWVGGRYSVWSAVALPLACAIGMERFRDFLAGGADIDHHFQHAPFADNLPVLMGLTDFWNASVLGLETLAVLPYSHRLRQLPMYLQQLEMESNGKRTTFSGDTSCAPTSPVVWGGSGIVGQHAYHQQIYQGTRTLPMHFVVPIEGDDERARGVRLNALGQSAALMRGKTLEEARAELLAGGADETAARRLAAHVACPGNQPSSTLLLPALSARTLGRLIALYEHKVFVQGWLLGINSFDQYGVEYGKQMARTLATGSAGECTDSSTAGLLQAIEAQLHSRVSR